MTNIIILGAGSFARELYCWIKQSEIHQNIIFKGFLNDKKDSTPKLFGLEKYYLGSYDTYIPQNKDSFIPAIADVNDRELVYRKLKNKNYNVKKCFNNSKMIM